MYSAEKKLFFQNIFTSTILILKDNSVQFNNSSCTYSVQDTVLSSVKHVKTSKTVSAFKVLSRRANKTNTEMIMLYYIYILE